MLLALRLPSQENTLYPEVLLAFLQCPDKFHFRKFQSAENTHEKQQQLPLPAHHSYHTCHDTYLKAAEGKKRVPLKIPAVVLSWVFFVFAFTYGNALSVQKDYTDFRTQLVISDLQEMEAFQSDTPVTVQLSGSIGNAPVLRNMPQNYQMLNRLIPDTFGGGDDLTQYGFYCYYGMRNVVWNPDVDLREMDLPVVEDNMYHTIRGEGSCVLVELK